jgi:hypothetical protein
VGAMTAACILRKSVITSDAGESNVTGLGDTGLEICTVPAKYCTARDLYSFIISCTPQFKVEGNRLTSKQIIYLELKLYAENYSESIVSISAGE